MPGKVIVLVPLISKKISTRTVLNQMGPSIKRVPQYYMVVVGGCRNQTPPLSTRVALQFRSKILPEMADSSFVRQGRHQQLDVAGSA
jgi:ribosomal protein S6E (S10)